MAFQSLVLKETLFDAMAEQYIALPKFDSTFLHEPIGAILNTKIGKLMEYGQLIINLTTRETWIQMAANEFGRLMDGLK